MKDVAIIVVSIVFAVFLVRSGALTELFASAKQFEVIGSFIAGMFFTSVFTTAPAIVTLGEIARDNNVIFTAIVGAMGSVVGDLIIFRFIRDRFAQHLMEALQHQTGGKKLKHFLKLRYFRWMTFLIGGAIIASPLPDELGITLLGFSKMKIWGFVMLSFVFNCTGIVLIGLIARSL